MVVVTLQTTRARARRSGGRGPKEKRKKGSRSGAGRGAMGCGGGLRQCVVGEGGGGPRHGGDRDTQTISARMGRNAFFPFPVTDAHFYI